MKKEWKRRRDRGENSWSRGKGVQNGEIFSEAWVEMIRWKYQRRR